MRIGGRDEDGDAGEEGSGIYSRKRHRDPACFSVISWVFPCRFIKLLPPSNIKNGKTRTFFFLKKKKLSFQLLESIDHN